MLSQAPAAMGKKGKKKALDPEAWRKHAEERHSKVSLESCL